MPEYPYPVNEKWMNTQKKVDPNFEGSVHQQLGLSDILCPTCEAHCQVVDGNLICLNACHLVPQAQENFHKLWLIITKGATDVESIIENAQEWRKNQDGS